MSRGEAGLRALTHRTRLSVVACTIATAAGVAACGGTSGALPAKGRGANDSTYTAGAARLVRAGARRDAGKDAWVLGNRSLAITRDAWRHHQLLPKPPRALAVSVLATETVAVRPAGRRQNEIELATFADGAHRWQVGRPIDLGAAFEVGGAEIVDARGHLAGLMITSTGNLSRGMWLGTPDEGRTWRVRQTPAAGTVTDEHGLWLVGEPLNSSIYRSSDDGASWQRVSIPVAGLHGAAAFSPIEADGRALVTTATTEHETLVVVGSFAGAGAAWRDRPTLRLGGSYGTGTPANTAIAAGTLWVLGSFDRLARVSLATGDFSVLHGHGLPWNGETFVYATGARTAWAWYVTQVCHAFKSHCEPRQGLVATTDGGGHWSAIGNPLSG